MCLLWMRAQYVGVRRRHSQRPQQQALTCRKVALSSCGTIFGMALSKGVCCYMFVCMLDLVMTLQEHELPIMD